jgi:hypothetical protein
MRFHGCLAIPMWRREDTKAVAERSPQPTDSGLLPSLGGGKCRTDANRRAIGISGSAPGCIGPKVIEVRVDVAGTGVVPVDDEHVEVGASQAVPTVGELRTAEGPRLTLRLLEQVVVAEPRVAVAC